MRTVLLGLVLAQAARAQSLAVSVMDAPQLSDEKVKRVHKASVEALKQLAALPVDGAFDWKGPKKACARADLDCQRERVKATGAAAVLALWVSGAKDPLLVDAVFFIDSDRASAIGSGDEAGLKMLLEAALPAWLRRGWGGVRLSQLEPGTTLKLDGRVLTGRRLDVLPATAGPHQLDVLFPDGRAVLQRIEVIEGSRTGVEVAPPVSATAPVATGISGVRVFSYATWMVGTATLLSAFIVGFVGRQTATGFSPCRPDNRECVSYAMAEEQQRVAQGYAAIANVLLGTGLVVSLAGAGFFTFDVLR